VRATRRSLVFVCVLVCLGLLAAACGDKKSSSGSGGKVVKGGTVVLAAEQEPDCTDWIGSCSGSSWGYWVMGSPTLPRAFDVDADSHYVPGPALASEPQLDKGPPQKVTYKLKSDAVWSDGQPITSHDFKYTWDQIAHGKDIYDKTGYEKIKDVDDKDARVAVVTFSEPFAAWKDLFGAFYGILPSHLLEGKDRSALTKNGYNWSGGPWLIDHWTKGQEVKLVPNPKYFGKKPNLDAVVFKFITDTSAEFQAYKTGQALGGYPQPQIGGESQLKSATDINFKPSEGLSYEGIWFNAEKPPLNEKPVRQALAYATDREAIVGQINKPYKPDSVVLQSFFPPGIDRKFAKNSYEKYTRDLKKVDELMTGAGWAKGADGIWAKRGQRASLTISTTAGNKAREIVEQLIQSQWKEAGFELKTNNTKAGTLFGEWLPKGTFQVAMYAQVPTPDPGQCVIWCSKNVPGPANNNSGQNFTRLKSPVLDKAWEAADTELDESKRADLTKQGIDALADEVPALPLYSKLTIVVWSRTIGGPVDDDFTLGPFWNMHLWFLKK
jgi:peptide/nickel transport system substrate-binding protein